MKAKSEKRTLKHESQKHVWEKPDLKTVMWRKKNLKKDQQNKTNQKQKKKKP